MFARGKSEKNAIDPLKLSVINLKNEKNHWQKKKHENKICHPRNPKSIEDDLQSYANKNTDFKGILKQQFERLFFHVHCITIFTYVILEKFHAQNSSFTGSFQDIFT